MKGCPGFSADACTNGYCPNSSTTTGGTDITKYVVKVGNGFIKRVEDNGDIVLTLAWGVG